MGDDNNLSPLFLIPIIGVCCFAIAAVIYFLYTHSTHSNAQNNNNTSSINVDESYNNDDDDDDDEDGLTGISMSSSTTTMLSSLPYRSSSNMTLNAFTDNISKHNGKNKQTELISELKLNTIKWIAICRVGTGGFSEVFHIIDKSSKKSLAMKWIKFERSVAKRRESQSVFKTFHFESEILNKINHQNIISYFGRSVADNQMIIYLELAPCGNLSHLISIYGKLPEYLS